MKRIALVAALLGVSVMIVAGIASAGKVGQAKTWIYDPGKTEKVSATWTKDGLSLQKNIDTSANAAAGVTFKGVEGTTLTQLSFDVKTTAYCGSGAPRFNVYTDAGTQFFGCAYGTHTDLGNGWTRVEFAGGEPGAGAFNVTITDGVEVVQDEQGSSLLRNISVNGIAVDKFPHS
jgi:hypothetical protein